MNKKVILTLSAFIMMLPVVACAPLGSQDVNLGAPEMVKLKQDGYKAVKAVLDGYVSNLPGKLEGQVSNNFIPNKQEFINHVEQSAIDKTVMNIDFSVSKSVPGTEGKLAVKFRWNRTYMPKGAATQIKDSGTTTFVFVNKNDNLYLFKTSGADIF